MKASQKTSVKWIPLLIIMAIILYLWIFIAPPEGIDQLGFRSCLIFIGTIACIIAEVLPLGAIGLLAMTVFAILRPSGASDATQAINIALSELNSNLIWLVVAAFMIARGFIKTDLSRRIAYYLVKVMGKNTLGLAYGLALTDILLAPAIPSTTARAGGILYPIAEALALNFKSNPKDSSRNRIGTFLMLNISHVNDITSAMFLTAFTGNLLAAKLINSELGMTLPWGHWFFVVIVPCLISLLVIPLVIYWLTNPELKKIPDAPYIASEELRKMGKMCRNEIMMASIVILLLVLWIGGSFFGLNGTTTAFVGLSILLLSGILSWDDIINEKAAWDTLIWFAALLMMAGQVSKLGVTQWLGKTIGEVIEGYLWHSSWIFILILLCLAYVYLHYLFASANAHIAALFPVFLTVALSLGVPTMIAIFALIMCTNYFGSLTPYANARNPLLFSEGFVPVRTWWKVGFICSLINLFILFTMGLLWWKIIDLD